MSESGNQGFSYKLMLIDGRIRIREVQKHKDPTERIMIHNTLKKRMGCERECRIQGRDERVHKRKRHKI